ncbi:response regulator [Motiliproteus sp. SC1-56]|uniref:response regulator n=1 Tax=Motiliproteus sp. SC1-56 TaxID=2799565 RepID=UPI001A8E8A21|nr:response regulator [Motiliproteus sp. SC1-56]
MSLEILLAEDNPDHAELSCFALQKVFDGCRIIHVSHGEAVLSFLEERAQGEGLPDLLVLDIKMPRMNGYEVLRALKASTDLASLPIIMVTTSSDEGDYRACLRLGASGYLVKPIKAGSLRDCLQALPPPVRAAARERTR